MEGICTLEREQHEREAWRCGGVGENRIAIAPERALRKLLIKVSKYTSCSREPEQKDQQKLREN